MIGHMETDTRPNDPEDKWDSAVPLPDTNLCLAAWCLCGMAACASTVWQSLLGHWFSNLSPIAHVVITLVAAAAGIWHGTDAAHYWKEYRALGPDIERIDSSCSH